MNGHENNYFLSATARADGYMLKDIKVIHHGQDYSKVEVHWQNGEVAEMEIPHVLAAAIQQLLDGEKGSEIPPF